jgi:hypothetical protein
LRVGNIEIDSDPSDQAYFASPSQVEKACHLLGLLVAEFSKAVLRPRSIAGREWVKNPIVFIGSPGSAMLSLGDKILSTIVAQHAQVPCMALSGTGILDTVMSPQGFVTVLDDAYAKACVNSCSWEEGLDRAKKIG